MNCQDINRILDAGSAAEQTQSRNEAVRLHLESCRACEEDWASWNEFASLPVPSAPAGLLARITAALPAPIPQRVRRPLRPFLIGGALVAGLALAAAAWQMGGRVPQSTVASASSPRVADITHESAEVPRVSVRVDQPSGSPAQQGERAPEVAMDSRTVLLVKRPEAVADARALAIIDRCQNDIITELRSLGGLNIVTDSPVFRITAISERFILSERDQKIARQRGAGTLLMVSTDMGCNVTQFNSQTREVVQGAGFGGADPQGQGMYLFAMTLARSVHASLLVDSGDEASSARAALLNNTLSDVARAQALVTLTHDRKSGPLSREAARTLFDKDVMAAVIQLATKSPDAGIRSSAILALRSADDPTLVQSLLQSLVGDPDKTVRMQAAYTVRKYLAMPGVREALLHAAAEDADSQPSVSCCIETVREAAERASIPDAEFRTWVRRKLMDDSLPARSRLFALGAGSMDGRVIFQVSNIGEDAAGVVFEIGQREQDPVVRSMAWQVLGSAKPEKRFVPVLLNDLRNHPDEYVRANAAKVLRRHADNAEVQEALQRAQTDASMEVRRAVAGPVGG